MTLNPNTFLGSLFDRKRYPDRVSFSSFPLEPEIYAGDPLPVKAPNNPGVGLASYPIMQGILALTMSSVSEIGYDASDTEWLALVWKTPTKSKTEVKARLNLKTRVLEVSDPNWAGQSFGLLGILVAFHLGIEAFKSTWISFLIEIQSQRVKAVNSSTIGCVADICYGALAYGRSWPTKDNTDPVDWTVNTADLSKLKLAKNLKNVISSPKDVESLMDIVEPEDGSGNVRFMGEQLNTLIRFIERKKSVALLGPPGVGKSLCAFEALRLAGYEKKGIDYQLFTCHEEVKTFDLIGSWQPDSNRNLRWVDGVVVRAMTGNGGKGMPILVEEFTRMPTKSQNIFISVLSDRYLIRNEKPDENGVGEIVMAGPDFMLIADMNVDPSTDDIDLYGAAFSSRVRKLEFVYPRVDLLEKIVRSEAKVNTLTSKAVGRIYDFVMKKFVASEVPHPLSPRDAVYWMQDLQDLVDRGTELRAAAQIAAKHTWLRDVGGADEVIRKSLLDEIEGEFRKLVLNSQGG